MKRHEILRELIDSQAMLAFVRMGRQSGKTTMIIDYIIHYLTKNINKRILAITPHREGFRILADRLREKAPGLIIGVHDYNDKRIDLANGCQVNFLSMSNEIDERMLHARMCGARTDLIVIDEAGCIPFSDIMYNLRLEAPNRIKMLMFGTEVRVGSFMDVLRDRRHSSAVYFTHDYRDAMKDRIFSPSNIFALKQAMTEEAFKREYGPFDPLVQIDNEMFMDKLHSMWEYA